MEVDQRPSLGRDIAYAEHLLDEAIESLMRFGRAPAIEAIRAALRRHGLDGGHVR